MSGNQTDSWIYCPFGEVQSHIGSSTTPLTFLGTLGYHVDFLNRMYVRARHLKVDLTTWMTVDPLWPGQKAYGYVRSRPPSLVDPSGLITLGEIGGGFTACVLGGGISWVLSNLINDIGHLPSQGNFEGCKAAATCLGVLAGTFAGVGIAGVPVLDALAPCLTGAVASAVSALINGFFCNKIPCPGPVKNPTSPTCLIVGAVAGAVAGCVAGYLTEDIGSELVEAILNSLAGALGEDLGQSGCVLTGLK